MPTLVSEDARTDVPRVVLVRTLVPPIATEPAPPKNARPEDDNSVALMPPLATMGLEDVTPTRVPTLVSDELTTEDPRVVLVRTLAVESRSKARKRPSAELDTAPVTARVDEN